jgi:branched-chain amino acid transport system substrate-binding protein
MATGLLCVFSAVVPCLWAQDPVVPKDIKSAHDDRSYEDVIIFAEAFLGEHPDSPACGEVRYLAGEACWHMKRYAAAEEFLTPLVSGGIRPPRWPQAVLLLSRSLDKQRKSYEGAVWLSELLSAGAGKDTVEDAEDLLTDLIRKSLSAEELNYIAFRYRASPLHCEVLQKAAQTAMDGKHWDELWDLLGLATDECAEAKRKTWDKLLAAAAREAPPGRCLDPYLVGLACAIEGPYAQYGESLRRGVSMALEEYNAGARYRLGLVVRDTGGDPILAVAAGRELATEDGVVCLMGGLLSSTTIALSGVASALQLPLVSPSATREEIALAGPFVYQSTLPRLLQARALAGAARSKLGATKAAVLFPETEDGELVSTSFVSAFEAAGGEVVFSSGYLEGETNFSGVLSAASSKSPDCLLLAGGGRDLTPLIPQLAYFDLNIPVLALESIGTGGVAELARRHLDRVLYAPDAYSMADETLADFEERYEAAYEAKPDEFSIKGYLAFKILAVAMQGGVRTRSGVAGGLGQMVTADPALADKRFLSMTALPGVEIPVLELITPE